MKWSLLIVLILFLPLALMAIFLPPNEYAALADGDLYAGIDCDSPTVVMFFAIPSFIVYSFGIISFISIYLETKKIYYLLIISVCGIILASIASNALTAIKLHNLNISENIEVCGRGW